MKLDVKVTSTNVQDAIKRLKEKKLPWIIYCPLSKRVDLKIGTHTWKGFIVRRQGSKFYVNPVILKKRKQKTKNVVKRRRLK